MSSHCENCGVELGKTAYASRFTDGHYCSYKCANKADLYSVHDTFNVDETNNDSKNNGGRTDYYDIPNNAKQAQDIIEYREMNYSQGNIFKVAFTFNVGRHEGTDYKRDLNKIIYFAKRELKRIK